MKVRIRLIRARPDSYMISENPKVSLGIVDCSLYTRRLMLKEDSHKQLTIQLSTTTWKNWQRFVTFMHDRTNLFKKIYSNNAPLRPIAIAMNSMPAFAGSFAENPFWYQQFNKRDIRILRGGRPFIYHDTTDNCCLYVTTMKAMNFQEDIPSIPVDNFKNHYVLVFGLNSMQDATEHCRYPELNGEPLRLELCFSSTLENVTEVILLGERMSSVVVNKFGVVGKNLSDG